MTYKFIFSISNVGNILKYDNVVLPWTHFDYYSYYKGG